MNYLFEELITLSRSTPEFRWIFSLNKVLHSITDLFFNFYCVHPQPSKRKSTVVSIFYKQIEPLLNMYLFFKNHCSKRSSKLYPSNMPRMLNNNLTRFMQSPSRLRQNQTSRRKALIAVFWLSYSSSWKVTGGGGFEYSLWGVEWLKQWNAY